MNRQARIKQQRRRRQNEENRLIRRRHWWLLGGPLVIDEEPTEDHVRGLLQGFVECRAVELKLEVAPIRSNPRRLMTCWTAEIMQELLTRYVFAFDGNAHSAEQ